MSIKCLLKGEILTALFLFCGALVNAQELPGFKRKIFFDSYKIAAGPGFSTLRGSPYVDNNSVTSRKAKVGYSFGLTLNHSLSRKFGFESSVFFEKKGSISSYNSTYFDPISQSEKQGKIKNIYAYDCVSLPLMILYSPDKNNRIGLALGIYTSYLIRQTMKIEYVPQGPGGIEDQTNLNTLFDFGISQQIEYLYPLSPKLSISTKLLNIRGLTNTRSDPDYGIVKTNNTSFLVGIMFKR